MASRPQFLSGLDLIVQKTNHLADLAATQATILAENPTWRPCAHKFERPADANKGPETLVCFGVAKPAYFREVVHEGKKYIVAECPRHDAHGRLRQQMRDYGWTK